MLLVVFSNALVYAQTIDTTKCEQNLFDTIPIVHDIENFPNYIIISSNQEQDKTIYLVKDKTTKETKYLIVEYFTIEDRHRKQVRKNIKLK